MTEERLCKKHGKTIFSKRANGIFRCRMCSVDAVIKRRRDLKEKSVEYLGGCCSICGYKKSFSALEFHHIKPEEKSFAISGGNTKSWDNIKKELDKCVLVCANCHRELEYANYGR